MRLRAASARSILLLPLLVGGGLEAQLATGRVVDAVSGSAVVGARVTASDSAGQQAAAASSDRDGAFLLRLPAPGAWTFRAERIGFRDGHATRIATSGDSLQVTLRMTPRSIRLDSLTATARARRRPLSLDVAGSFRRRAAGADSSGGTAAATGERGRIEVRGSTITPDPCHRLAGGLSTHGSVITLVVEAHDTGEPCSAGAGLLGYSATIGGVAPGRYVLQVIHDYPGLGWASRLALETEVSVR